MSDVVSAVLASDWDSCEPLASVRVSKVDWSAGGVGGINVSSRTFAIMDIVGYLARRSSS